MPPLMAPLVFALAKSSLNGINAPKGISKESLHAPIEAICKAVCSAWAVWQSTATLQGVMIQGVVAVGGKLVSTPIEPLIRANAPPDLKKLLGPVAAGLQEQLALWAQAVKVPGMPWYPSFAALPMPMAPPTPNVPCPLAAIAPAGGPLGRNALKQAMVSRLPIPHPRGSEQLCEAIAAGIEGSVQLWLLSTMVTNVMGTGPVPTFAPPYVPVGPVVAGVGNQIPGGMI